MKSLHFLCLLTFVVIFSIASPAQAGKLNVAVFNFQMKSKTPEWKWLQKGLADQITTDFTRSRRITVVARDEMQLLAKKMRWTPEMALVDARAIELVKKQLKIDHLVTGVYSIKNGCIEIVAQIIEVGSRKEVARKIVSGKADDVLKLQKKVSAELLGWFSGMPAEKILPHIPVWTQSIAATKALYQGMHLYDEGRYAEAWLLFRQSWRNDKDYLEAHYWVARMYYFMDRYEHARRAYERFVYMDETHPRIGDAIKEYLHTYEKAGMPPEALLELYADFMCRFPTVPVYNELGLDAPVTTKAWLQVRSGQVLGQLGRYKQATLLASMAVDDLRQKNIITWWDNWAYYVARINAQTHHMLTGEVLMPKGLVDIFNQGDDKNFLRFKPGQREAEVLFKKTRTIPGQRFKGRVYYRTKHAAQLILAPNGYVFTKLSLYPIVDGKYGKITCWLNRDSHMDAGKKKHYTSEVICKRGFHFDNIPRCGIFQLIFYMNSNNIERDPELKLHGYRAVVEMEKTGPHGAIDVTCLNTNNFSIYVDGKLSRKRDGLIGLLSPGKHVVSFRPYRGSGHYATYEQTVNVKAGKTTYLEVSLPWKKNSPWASWTAGTLIGRDYPDCNPCLQTCLGAPTIQADSKVIRVFWSYQGDLWWAVSTDGKKFSRPKKLPMPISSGWIEQDPQCFRDESGRFLLIFRSDREGQHQMRTYVCWSRDGIHWSRPAMVVDRTVNKFHMIQDDKGQFIWADATGKTVTVMKSRNGYRWEQAAQWTLDDEEREIRIIQRDDGGYELFVAHIFRNLKANSHREKDLAIQRYLSKDCSTWSEGKKITRLEGTNDVVMSLLHIKERTLVGILRENVYAGGKSFVRFAQENTDGTFKLSKCFWGIGFYYGAMTYHPRWGYMIVWYYPPNPGDTFGASGPYLIRGEKVEQFLRWKGKKKKKKPRKKPQQKQKDASKK